MTDNTQAQLAFCSSCGRPITGDELSFQMSDGTFCCSNCLEKMTVCESCGYLFDSRSGSTIWQDICHNCEDDYFVCDSCGERCHMNDYAEDDLCLCCYEDIQGNPSCYIREYHDSPGYIFHSLPEETTKLYFGVELETDKYPNLKEVAEKLHELDRDEELFFMTEDGSLERGIEIISHPMTLAFHKQKMIWKDIIEISVASGGKSQSTDTCGLHIHFSRAFFNERDEGYLYQLRLVYIVEKFWTELTTLARRSSGYAKKWDKPLTDRPARSKVQEITREGDGHYAAVNLCPYDTIEIRLFKGTLDIKTLLASLELVDFLARSAKRLSIQQLRRFSWLDLVANIDKRSYDYLPAYLKKLNLHPCQKPKSSQWTEPELKLLD